ncbi:phosphatidate cytidylyltransferase [Candidatus Liberibacter africanus]|uniref:Phosphatidate cytidylyltransferase n=1 Tax=Candidatus Liberibacter africanus PTSAPSY TaxID=1277257 RepID=A0A0G3I4F1_LIBAF|nr:phosphatidate cytidylyltransferase [Candidatus Liberibacter africanus]AKK20115.1 phosphatidate cytidylyltransferase protein [Candidatus Liberibacter africanus PTSAPSY]QTP63923.1 phosphatidate cytidylyltransferase [Candidatus Liberibacter africanus]
MSQELRLRIVTGFVIACSFILISLIGGIWFRLWAIMMSLCIYYEWEHITSSISLSLCEKIIGCIAFFIIFFMVVAGFFKASFVLLVLYFFIDWMVSIIKKRHFWHSLGIIYSVLPSIALSYLRGDNDEGLFIVLFVFSVVWATDVFAYIIGRFIGGPKIAPKISPKKTWSGSIGGGIGAVGVGIVFFSLLDDNCFQLACILSLILSISCQLGDFFESYIKRHFGVKQSGWFLPGHGGIMDRFDGLIFACLLMSVFSFMGR